MVVWIQRVLRNIGWYYAAPKTNRDWLSPFREIDVSTMHDIDCAIFVVFSHSFIHSFTFDLDGDLNLNHAVDPS